MSGLSLSDFDLVTLAEAGVEMPLDDHRVRPSIDADGEESWPPLTDAEGNVLSVRVLGEDAPAVQKTLASMRARAMTIALQANTRKGVRMSIDDVQLEDADAIKLASAATIGWSHSTDAFTPDNVRTLYTKDRFHREQVIRFMKKRSNFFPSR